MIFAREISDNLTSLVKKIDEATVQNSGCKMGSFVVFLSDDKDLEAKLKSIADSSNLKKCVLSIDNPAGPKGYGVSEKADVTVVLYKERKVVVNQSYGKGELTGKDIDSIVSDVSKITK